MEREPSMMKGLLNDLTRTLLSSAIFLDDLHLNLQPNSEVYDAWWLANEQFKRAIEFFLELRSTCFWFLGSGDLGNKGNGDGHFSKPKDPTLPLLWVLSTPKPSPRMANGIRSTGEKGPFPNDFKVENSGKVAGFNLIVCPVHFIEHDLEAHTVKAYKDCIWNIG